MTTLRRFCAAVGWPRQCRRSDAIERVKATEAAARPAPAFAPEPASEVHLTVVWLRSCDDSNGKFPPARSGGGWLYGVSDAPRLAIPLVWTEPKYDRSRRRHYEKLYFVAPVEAVEGKTLVVNGRALGTIAWSNIPSDGACRYDAVPGELKPDGLIRMPQIELPPDWTDAVCDELGVSKPDRR